VGGWLHRDCPFQYRTGDSQGSRITIAAELYQPILTTMHPKPAPIYFGRVIIEPPKM